jgi:dTDP-4-dehydrorhamnose 3,5-epimerase
MNFIETKLQGTFIIEPERFRDERGFFAPSFSAAEFSAHGLASVFVENNISYSANRGTLRGMHYQAAPHGQAKLIRCTRGAIFDVALDLRPDSETFRQWVGVELSADNRSMVYVPGDYAHGFQTLQDDTEVFYMVSQPYLPDSSRGVRWNDPTFGIQWPLVDALRINKRDREYPDFNL